MSLDGYFIYNILVLAHMVITGTIYFTYCPKFRVVEKVLTNFISVALLHCKRLEISIEVITPVAEVMEIILCIRK